MLLLNIYLFVVRKLENLTIRARYKFSFSQYFFANLTFAHNGTEHCVKSVRIWSFLLVHFLYAFILNIGEYNDQKNYVFGHFSRCGDFEFDSIEIWELSFYLLELILCCLKLKEICFLHIYSLRTIMFN